MSLFSKKLVQILSDRFRVAPEFSQQLVPLFERYAERRPSPAEWEDVLARVAAAYHATPPAQAESESISEAHVLVSQFLGELKKMDERLKVLAVYLQRLREHLSRTDASRVVH